MGELIITHPWSFGVSALAGIVLSWWAAYRGPMSRLRGLRRLSAFAGTLCVCLSLGSYLSGVSEAGKTTERAVLLLVDRSASASPDSETRAQTIYRELRANLPHDALLGVAEYHGSYGDLLPFAPVEDLPENILWNDVNPSARLSTRLTSAVRLGALGMPAHARGQLAIISDGQGVGGLSTLPLQTVLVPVEQRTIDDVALDRLDLRHSGNGATISIHVWSTMPATGVLAIRLDGETRTKLNVDLQPGMTPIVMAIEQLPPTGARLEVNIVSSADTLPGNETLAVDISPNTTTRRVLLLDGSADMRAGKQLAVALSTPDIAVDHTSAADAAGALERIDRYQALILADVSATQIDINNQKRIEAWVKAGGGIVMLGGPQSFAPGGWYDTPLEKTLPVSSRVEREKGEELALVISLDRSGSMSAPAGDGSKMDQANRGAELSMGLVMDGDLFGVLSTDTDNEWIVPFAPLHDRKEAVRALRRHAVGGGGIDVTTSLDEAYDRIRGTSAKRKHVLLFADGDDADEQGDWVERAARERAENGIELSTIAIGTGKDVTFLERLAKSGGGRSFVTEDALSLPLIFSAETARIGGGYIVERSFVPSLVRTGELTAELGIESAPELEGMVATREREDATVWLRGPDAAPLLATKRYGLGRGAVFTSDARDRWADAWLDWQGFPKLWQRLTRWLCAGPNADQLDFSYEINGDAIAVEFQHGSLPAGHVTGLLRGPKGEGRNVEIAPVSATGSAGKAGLWGEGMYRLSLWLEPTGD
ncbi:MAG: glutamine amidotransferase, partial [Planctomycetes bacterium]|nr:glutamine amidotransferase [Planctomycetota bacterium]